MNNITSFTATTIQNTSPTPLNTTFLGLYIAYVIIGTVSTLGNLLVLVAILRESKLREKYILQLGLAGGDIINSIAHGTTGIVCLYYEFSGLFSLKVTRWTCALRYYTPLFVLSNQLPAVFDLLISLDRLLAITKPLPYFSAPKKKITTIATAIAYAYCILSTSLLYVAASNENASTLIGYSCVAVDSVGQGYAIYNYGFSMTLGIAAIILYIIAVLMIGVQNKKHKNDAVAMERLRAQHKRTQLMAIVVGLSFIFFVLPAIGYFVLAILNNRTINITASPIFGITFCLHSSINVLVYTARSEELRKAFATVLCCGRLKFSSKVIPEPLHHYHHIQKLELEPKILSLNQKPSGSEDFIAHKTPIDGTVRGVRFAIAEDMAAVDD